MKQSAVGGVFVYRQNPQNKLDVVGLQQIKSLEDMRYNKVESIQPDR
jgi:hypothetical protein